MKIAFISDIHGNIYALKKVLDDIKKQELDQIICLGDLVGYATHPNEVIDLIRKNEILTIQGNYDESIGKRLPVCGCDYKDPAAMERSIKSLSWTQQEVSPKNREWLKELPVDYRLNIGGKDIYLVHGSPRRNNEYLYSDNPSLQEIFDEYKFDILVCGHTHRPYFKAVIDRYIVNAGSAGKPKHGNPRATYIILEITDHGVDFFSREVDYDYEKAAADIESTAGMPDEFAELFRKGIG